MGVVILYEGEILFEGAISFVRGGVQEIWGRKVQSNLLQGSYIEFSLLNIVDVNIEDFVSGSDIGLYDILFLWVVFDKEIRGLYVEYYRVGWGNYGGRCVYREGIVARGRDCGLFVQEDYNVLFRYCVQSLNVYFVVGFDWALLSGEISDILLSVL